MKSGIFNTIKPRGPASWTKQNGWSAPKPLPPHIMQILLTPPKKKT